MRRAGTARLSRRRAGNGELSMQRVGGSSASRCQQATSCREQLPSSEHVLVDVDGGLAKPAQRPRSGRRAQTQLPLPESENGVVGSAM
jgi:hypothetical protein